jgi:hypothetical protein
MAETCPSSSAPAFEVMFPPSKPATTERRSAASNSNSFGVLCLHRGAPWIVEKSLLHNDTLRFSAPMHLSRVRYPG